MTFHSLLGEGSERKRPITAKSILPSASRRLAARAAGSQPRFDHAEAFCHAPRLRARVPERRKRFGANVIRYGGVRVGLFNNGWYCFGSSFSKGLIRHVPGPKTFKMAPALEQLLAEDYTSVVARERKVFDESAHPHQRSLVFVGAGWMGAKALQAVRGAGIEPVAFADDNKAMQGRTVDGVPVFSMEEAASKFGLDAAFVVTLLRPEVPFTQVRDRLTALGCGKVVSSIPLFWKHPTGTLPHAYVDLPSKLTAQAEQVKAAFRLMSDDASRRLYSAQIAYRLHLDLESIPEEMPVSDQYFPTDLCALRGDEFFVDCGAFDGDTLRHFLAHSGGDFGRYLALEPDAKNFRKLQEYCATLAPGLQDRIDLQPFAVGRIDGTLRFDERGSNGSLLSQTGAVEVACRRLESLCGDGRPSYIKMDIEGGELDALEGMGTLCARFLPVLAVGVYHVQDHLWKIPLLMQNLSDDYRLFLRSYSKEGMELVCYAIPKARLR